MKWFKDLFRCNKCDIHEQRINDLKDQITFLISENSDLKDINYSLAAERADLHKQLMELLAPRVSQQSNKTPIGGVKTWTSFVQGRKKANRAEKEQDLPIVEDNE